MTSASIDPKEFRAFEQDGWQKIPQQYHEAFTDLTTQAIGPLLDPVGVKQGMRLLDVATGPGYVAAAAAELGAQVIGVDFSTSMVAEARRLYPGIQYREGDAEELPFQDASFDAVVMNFGLLHLARPERALTEAYRVLCSGGRFGFTVWAKPTECIGFGIVLRAIEAHGKMNVGLPQGPPFFCFSDPEECSRTLTQAGFVSPEIQVVPQVWRLRNADALFNIMRDGTVRTAGLLRAQSRQAIGAIRKAIRQSVLEYQKGDRIELAMPAVLASAWKP